MSNSSSKTFCPWPWMYQAVRNNGDIRVCCQANQSASQGLAKKADGTNFNAATDSMIEARNAPLMKEIRKDMLAGKWNPSCIRCKTEESTGLRSGRQHANLAWSNIKIDDVRNATSEDGTIDTDTLPVISYDLRFGNLCNLACRMCGPADSHMWYEEWTKYNKQESFTDTHGVVKLHRNASNRLVTTDYDWHNSLKFWQQIESQLGNIQHVYMAGGEPLLIERHYEFLNLCINRDMAKNIILEYNTNGTNFSTKVLNIWKNFKEVRLGISVDGIKEVVEYQRWPVKWEQLHANLQKINQLAHIHSNIKYWLTVTVTAYNAKHIADMTEWIVLDSGLDKMTTSIMSMHVAHRPLNTNVKLLPKHVKQEISDRYATSINTLKIAKVNDALIHKAQTLYDGITTYMNSADMSVHMPKFISYTKFLDAERNQNILDIMPSLHPYFKAST